MSTKYQQIVKDLRYLIGKGELRRGALIGSERELAETYDVSRGTVVRAMNELKQQGLIKTEQGRGTYVTFSPPIRTYENVHRFSVMLKEAGIAHTVENDEDEAPVIAIPFSDDEELTVQAHERWDLYAEWVTWSQPAGEPVGNAETPLYAANDLDGLLAAVQSSLAKRAAQIEAESALFAHQDGE